VAEFRHQLAHQRETEPDDVVVVALDAGDEGAAEPVDGERAGHLQRLAGRDVRRDLGVGDVGEVHGRGCRRGGDVAGGGVVEAVAGEQHAGPAAHHPPPCDGLLGVGGLPEGLTVELEDRVAAEHQGAVRQVRAGGDGGALELRELERELRGRQRSQPVLVDARDDHERVDARGAERGQAGRGLRGEDEWRHRTIIGDRPKPPVGGSSVSAASSRSP